MDILQQYNKQFPEANKPAPQWQPPEEYGAIVRLAIKLSGGRIRDEKQANAVLVGAIIVMIIISLGILFSYGGSKKTLPDPTKVTKTLEDTVRKIKNTR